ncbi:MAG: tetratricopeptide repeat protein, partial [Verrucomicrobiales bacterium]
MITEIEASMTRTIREGLDAYRLKIDGDARALLARSTPETRESALAEIVLRYFLSSVGDDAAFELGCLKMERGESLPAVRLFTKIIDEYPASSIERPEVEIRLAGSLARAGSARQALE